MKCLWAPCLAVFGFVLQSCSVFECLFDKEPKLTKRYSSYDTAFDSGGISVTGFSLPITQPDEKKTILNLSERGQAELIKSLAAIPTKSEDALFARLGKHIVTTSPPAPFVDKSLIKRRLVFSVEHQQSNALSDTARPSYYPADRIARLSIALLLEDTSKGSLVNWDKAGTVYETVDLGKLTLTQASSVNLGVGVTAGVEGGIGASIGANRTDSLVEEVLLKQRHVVITGSLETKKFTIVQESVAGRDLTGNTIVDLLIDFDDRDAYIFIFSNLFDDKGNPVGQESVLIRRQHVKFPTVDELKGTIVCDAIIRHVIDMDETITESDDTAKFIFTTNSSEVSIVDPSEFRFTEWMIRSTTKDSANYLKLKYEPGNVEDIIFNSYEEADSFLGWLKRKRSTMVSNFQLELGSSDLKVEQIAGLGIHAVPINWKTEK